MSNRYMFHCTFCGREFGEDVIELARHIGEVHDPTRTSSEKNIEDNF